jgi:N-methylhydantoinase A
LCYARGGTEPTITDAHAVLGRIPPHLLGGEIPLKIEAAREGLEKLAETLGLGLEACATGILEISAWNQANALRQVTVKRGLDVRDFTMATFGGSGSLLSCRLIDILGLQAVIVPMNPGNVSAFGLLTVDVKNDYVQTAVSRHHSLDIELVTRSYAELHSRAAEALDAEGFAPEQHRFLRSADLRYYGQAFEVRVQVPDGPIDQALTDQVAEAFHTAHEQLYGYCFRGDERQQVEWVNLRVTGVGPIRRPELAELPPREGGVERAQTGVRRVYFDGYHDTPIYWRPDFAPGDAFQGPAVIEEFGSTIPIHPGFVAQVDRFGNVLVTRATAKEEGE